MVGDSFENVASLQDCHFQQRDSVQTLGKILTVEENAYRDGQMFPRKTIPAVGKHQSVFVRVTWEHAQRIPHLFFSLANNSPFFLGVNTKQLSNQMLELTKVINELKDVLIQQVTTTNSSSEAT